MALASSARSFYQIRRLQATNRAGQFVNQWLRESKIRSQLEGLL